MRALTGALLLAGTTAFAETNAPERWNCAGSLQQYPGVVHETAFADRGAPNAADRALGDAEGKLLDKLCGDRPECGALRAFIKQIKSGENDHQVCAMVGIKESDVAQWRASLDDDLDRKLRSSADELVKTIASRLKLTPPLRMAIAEVKYGGEAGGLRANWIKDRLHAALEAAGGDIIVVPSGWAGNDLPKGAVVLIDADLIPRRDAARGLPVLELDWSGRFKVQRALLEHDAPRLEFMAGNAPSGEPEVKPLPKSPPTLSVRIDAQEGGSLCRGQKTQVYLYSEKTQHVRVFDLFAGDQGILEFPRSDHPSDVIRAGETVALSDSGGMIAEPVGELPERFLVVGAETEEELGQLSGMSGLCRLNRELGKAFYDAEGLPAGVEVAATGYRVLNDPKLCPNASPLDAQAFDAALRGLPECR